VTLVSPQALRSQTHLIVESLVLNGSVLDPISG
jgi:hypothetical protein